jgi:hypothetical protein
MATGDDLPAICNRYGETTQAAVAEWLLLRAEEVENETAAEPPARTPRGFAVWAQFVDLYGHSFSVQRSSLADKHAVWIGSDAEPGRRGHLDVDQARRVRAALDAFIAYAEADPR